MQKAASKSYGQKQARLKRTVSFSKKFTNIFFHILTQCNLRCRHCYINPDQHGKQTLSLSDIESWLRVFSTCRESANLIFLGGEPTLHPDLSFAIKKARELGFGSVTVDTNGYLFNDILQRVTPEEVDYFSFSLDGPDPETNDPIRGRGSFEKCVSGICKAVSRGFHASLIYTVSRTNINQLHRMPAMLEKWGVKRLFIQVIGLRGQSARAAKTPADALQVSYDQWLSVVPNVAKAAAQMGLMVSWPKVYLESHEPFSCAGVEADNYFIFPNGRVYRCPLCEDYPLHSLRIRENRLEKMPPINEKDLFDLSIPEGCVMNKIIQPYNICYDAHGVPKYRVACCLLKEEIRPPLMGSDLVSGSQA